MTAAETELASQISISAQQEPWPPTPEFGSLVDGVQPSTLPCREDFSKMGFFRRAWTYISYLAVDKLEITGALRITVSNTILGTSLVSGESGHSTIRIHGHEVKRAIETARKIGDIHIKGKLVVQKVELCVRGIGIHKIKTRANIGSVRSNGNKCELQRVPACSSTVCGGIIGSLESAVGSTGNIVRAESGIPSVSGVAVCGRAAGCVVNPAPVGVNDNHSLLSGAAARSSALLPCQRRVSLRLLSADLLSADDAGSEGRSKGNASIHS